jgi:ankyrin repeat protein
LLLDQGADLNALDKRDQSALHKASYNGHVVIVKLLLERGANVDIPSTRGWTPLLFAARGGHLEIVQMLLDHGADLKAEPERDLDESGTALHLAAVGGHPQVVKTLLERGVYPHSLTKEGRTPFQLAKSSFWDGAEAIRAQIMQLISERTGESE